MDDEYCPLTKFCNIFQDDKCGLFLEGKYIKCNHYYEAKRRLTDEFDERITNIECCLDTLFDFLFKIYPEEHDKHKLVKQAWENLEL